MFGWIGEANFTAIQHEALPLKREAGLAALRLMDEHLSRTDYLVDERFTVADIVLYAYTHCCEEGATGRPTSPRSQPGSSALPPNRVRSADHQTSYGR